MNMKDRVKNIYFWIGILGVMLSSSGLVFEELTSWKLLFEGIMSVLSNPVTLLSMIMTTLGVFVDPTTSGFRDKK